MNLYLRQMEQISFGNIEVSGFETYLNENYSNSKKVILIDENVSEYYLEYFITTFSCLNEAEIICIPAGEENKCLEICAQVWASMSEYQISRKDLLINIGGGVTTDLGGFIASCYKRGIDFINIPTSLLAMVDASVGGKTGIDFEGYKNQIGVFANAKKVFVDSRFLKTLPEEELISGFAEMLKHGLIASEEHWNNLTALNNLNEISDALIQESVQIKNSIVNQDPKEGGLRKILNYGHTIGHAIESHFLKIGASITHGYAVALGMIYENNIASELGILESSISGEINEQILKYYSHLQFTDSAVNSICEFCLQDKKNENQEIQMSLIDSIGSCQFNVRVELELIKKVLTKK